MLIATVECGYRKAVVSKWVQAGGSIRFVVKGYNGGKTKIFKTEKAARKFAVEYCGK